MSLLMTRSLWLVLLASSALLITACGKETPATPEDGNNAQPPVVLYDEDMGSTTPDPQQDMASSNNMTTPAPEDMGSTTPAEDMGETPSGLTYYEHVRPILRDNCVECHVAGGIGAFALETYEQVKPLAMVLADAAERGAMPPWMPQDGCGDFRHARQLDAEQITTLRDWADSERAKGDTTDEPPAKSETQEGPTFERADLTLTPSEPYKPQPDAGEFDDFRCFVFEPNMQEDQYINGFRFTPSNYAVAHHMLIFTIPPERVDQIKARDDAEEGPGYTCFGGPGINDAQNVGTWIPGSQPLAFGPGTGLHMPAGSAIVVQMHYNTVNDAEGSDQFDLDLQLLQEPATTELVNTMLLDFSFVIPPGESEGKAGRSLPVPGGAIVHGIMPHMHNLGSNIRIWYETEDNPDGCMIDIPDWDYNWQNFYLYEEPFIVPPRSTVHLECTFDNSAANQPYDRQPQEVRWGDGTFDEMCLVFFLVER